MKELIFIWAALLNLHGEMSEQAIRESWTQVCSAQNPQAVMEFDRQINHVNGEPAALLEGICGVPEDEQETEQEDEPFGA